MTGATDGNHAIVAWGARRPPQHHYVHATVSPGCSDATAKDGAEVRRVSGNYDDAVRRPISTPEPMVGLSCPIRPMRATPACPAT